MFGGFDRTSKQFFIESVPDRSSETLLSVIQRKIKSGTTITSDCWKAYDCLNHEDYKHLTVNHKINFVDPNVGAHTQNIEQTWRETRANIPHYGIRTYHYVDYIAEFLFRRKFNFKDRLVAFFHIMAGVFPITGSTGA